MRVVLAQPTQRFIIIDDFISRLGGLCGLNVDIYGSSCKCNLMTIFLSSHLVIQCMFIYSQGRALTKSTVITVSVKLALTEQDVRITLTSVF